MPKSPRSEALSTGDDAEQRPASLKFLLDHALAEDVGVPKPRRRSDNQVEQVIESKRRDNL